MGVPTFSVIFITSFADNTKNHHIKIMGKAVENAETIEKNIYTVDEVSEHVKISNTLLIFEDKVIDVSEFIDAHPGGETVLKQYAGKDITDVFKAYHGSSGKAAKVLRSLVVGKIARSGEECVPGHLKEFRNLMKLEEGSYFESQYHHYYAIVIRLLVLLAITYKLVINSEHVILHMLGAVSLGFFWQQSMFIGHDAGHTAITYNRRIDRIIGLIIGNACNGVGIGWWSATHNVHHCAVNSLECDPDIQHMPLLAVTSKYFNSVFSLYHNRQIKFDWLARTFVSVQHYTFYPLMAVARVNLYAQTLIYCTTAKMSRNYRFAEFAALGFYFYWYTVLISCLPTTGEKVAFMFLSHAIGGIIHVQICLSHFSRDVFNGVPKNNEWVEMQLAGTMDIECPKYLDFFHGGLQFQVEHHLAPRIPRHKLREFREKIIKPYAAKYRLKNFHSVSFTEANIEVLRTLKKAAEQSVLSDVFRVENYT